MHYVKHLLLILILMPVMWSANGQTTQQVSQVKAVNNYILFANESDHGLLIIHRLLELYNQEINKLVNLPHYRLNVFSNADFPENIFVDKSGSFYRVSPSELYAIALDESSALPSKFSISANAIIGDMKAILDDLERERYSIGTLVANTDLNKMSNLKNVYAALDACVLKFDAYEAKRNELSALVEKMGPSVNKNDAFYKAFIVPYSAYLKDLHNMFDKLRAENTPEAVKAGQSLIKSAKVLLTASTGLQKAGLTKAQSIVLDELLTVLKKQISNLEKFLSSQTPPEEYELYGGSYYFYNIQLAGTTNKYGTGVVDRSNEWIKANGGNYIYGFERPHFFKVIRPAAIQEEEKKVAVDHVPEVDENRKVVVDKDKSISTNVEKLLIEVYDNQEFDHDTISLKFNGEWILQKQLITKEPIRIYLPLVKGQDNYLILYADNLGTIPPNTCAIRWINEKGKYNEVVLTSDYNTSEMIVIKRK